MDCVNMKKQTRTTMQKTKEAMQNFSRLSYNWKSLTEPTADRLTFRPKRPRTGSGFSHVKIM